MKITTFSIIMAMLWSNIIITALYLFRKNRNIISNISIKGIFYIYLITLLRIALPIDFDRFTHNVPGGKIWNTGWFILNTKIFSYSTNIFYVKTIVFYIFLVGAVYFIAKYCFHYYKIYKLFNNLAILSVPNSIVPITKRKVKIVHSPIIQSPCCIGILHPIIALPSYDYSKNDLKYILMHEFTHINNHDVLLKIIILIICSIYWWNPFSYILRRDCNQSLELRCDMVTMEKYSTYERVEYMSTILSEYKRTVSNTKNPPLVISLVDRSNEDLIERFNAISNYNTVNSKFNTIVAVLISTLVIIISYSFVFQSYFEPKDTSSSVEETFDITPANSYIIRRNDSYTLIVTLENNQNVSWTIAPDDLEFYTSTGISIRN